MHRCVLSVFIHYQIYYHRSRQLGLLLHVIFRLHNPAICVASLSCKAELLQLKPHPFICMRNFINKKVGN